MNRDPTVVGHAKVGAEMFAGVISGFVDELSWKTIVSGCWCTTQCRKLSLALLADSSFSCYAP